MNYVTSPEGITFIKNHEGCVLDFYADIYGYPTVGWGHLISKNITYTPNTKLTSAQAKALKNTLNLNYSSPITQTKADSFLASDIKTIAEDYVNALDIPSGYILQTYQFDALVSLTYCGGYTVLRTSDVKDMISHVQIYPNYPYTLSPDDIDTCSRFVSRAFSYDVNEKSRRNDEATLFCKGERYTHKYPVYTV